MRFAARPGGDDRVIRLECYPMRIPFLVLVLLMMVDAAHAQMIIAHRGASHGAPENTLAAFQLAWQEGADGVEGDFRLTADGQIVMVHDADTKRTANRKLVVAQATLEQLRELDFGGWKAPQYAGERIATLGEVLEAQPEGKWLFIELKTGPEIVEPLKHLLSAEGVPRERLVIIAFDQRVVTEVKQALPDIKAHWLTKYERDWKRSWQPTAGEVIASLHASKADGLGSQAKPSVFNEKFVAALRGAGASEFHVWTVDDPVVARFYLELGVWSLTTNRPAYLREQLGDALKSPGGGLQR